MISLPLFLNRTIMADVFEYIVVNNPDGVRSLANAYGYQCDTFDDGMYVLEDIAMNHGDRGFQDAMNLHPDKDIILGLFSSKKTSRHCKLDGMLQPTNQASGGTSTMQSTLPNNFMPAFNQTNTLLAVGIVALIGIAIIIKN